MREIIKGATNQSTRVRILNAATGLPETGVTAATAGLSLQYSRLGAAASTSIGTLSDLGSQTAPHTDGGLIHTGNGLYRVDPPDAAFADGADEVTIHGTATGMVIIPACHALVEAPAAGTGTGARTVTVTVTEGGSPLEGAAVRFRKGVENYVGETNVSGVVVFSLDDGTWAVAISLAGYTFTPTTLVVDGTETPAYAMTAAPLASATTTGFFTAYDEAGEPEEGVSIHVALAQIPAGDAGAAYDTTTRTILSDGDGLVSIPGMFKGLIYRFTRGTSSRIHLATIPADAGDSYELPSILGAA